MEVILSLKSCPMLACFADELRQGEKNILHLNETA